MGISAWCFGKDMDLNIVDSAPFLVPIINYVLIRDIYTQWFVRFSSLPALVICIQMHVVSIKPHFTLPSCVGNTVELELPLWSFPSTWICQVASLRKLLSAAKHRHKHWISIAAAGICRLKCFCRCFCCTFNANPEPRIPYNNYMSRGQWT